MRKHLLSFTLLLVTTIAIGQVNLDSSKISKLDSIAVQDVPNRAPGIATAVISDGEVIFKRYAGYENLADSTKLDDHSRFNIASNGKQFTALAILTLEEQKKLDLEDDIRKYLPEFYKDLEVKITIKNLLQHRSGIRDVYDLWSLKGITWWKQTHDNDDALNLIKKQTDLNFEPGSQYLYSNSNYILLAEIVERISQRTFKQFTDEIFQDLGMSNTSFESDYTQIKEPIAKAYFNFDTWSTYDWKWNVVGDGNLFSTLTDQIRWEQIIQGAIVSKVPKSVIKRSQQFENDLNYGFGLERGKYKVLNYAFHEGATGAWKATVVRFDDTAIITMTNSGKTIPSFQTRQMVDVLYNLENNDRSFLLAPEDEGDYVSEADILGIYLTDNNFAFEFKKKENGTLVLDRVGRGEVELERESDNLFKQKYDPAFKQEFIMNKNGEMTVTAYHTSHAPYSLTRPNADWDDFSPKSLNGTYFNNETGVEFILEHQEGRTYSILREDNQSFGKLVTPNLLLFNGYAIRFDFGKLHRFELDGDRIKKVMFRKL